MTSRSEYRLLLRQDNADGRLRQYALAGGLVSGERYSALCEKLDSQEKEISRLKKTTVSPIAANPVLRSLGESEIATGAKLAELIRRPGVTYESLGPCDSERPPLSRSARETVETEIKYEGYIRRQFGEASRQKKAEDTLLPEDIDYSAIRGLRLEAAQKLNKIRPASIGQASRISGVNPADISVLMIYLSIKK